MTEEGIDKNAVKFDFVALYIRSLKQLLVELEQREGSLVKLIVHESQESKKLTHFLMEDQTHSDEIARIKTVWQAVVDQFNRRTLEKDNTGYSMQKLAPVRTEMSFKRHLKFLGAGAIGGMLCVFRSCLSQKFPRHDDSYSQ